MDDATRAGWREKIVACFDERASIQYGEFQYDTSALDALLEAIDREARADTALKVGQWERAATPPAVADPAALLVEAEAWLDMGRLDRPYPTVQRASDDLIVRLMEALRHADARVEAAYREGYSVGAVAGLPPSPPLADATGETDARYEAAIDAAMRESWHHSTARRGATATEGGDRG